MSGKIITRCSQCQQVLDVDESEQYTGDIESPGLCQQCFDMLVARETVQLQEEYDKATKRH